MGESNVILEIQFVSDFKIRQTIDILQLSLSNFYETDSSRTPG